MDVTERMQQNEKAIMTKLSHAFGKEKFWQKTLIVLTFVNVIQLKRSSSIIDHFGRRMGQWKTFLQTALTDETGPDIINDIAENVPIVPAGYSNDLSLPAFECNDWLSKLWLQCLHGTKDVRKLSMDGEQLKEEDIAKKEAMNNLLMPKLV